MYINAEIDKRQKLNCCFLPSGGTTIIEARGYNIFGGPISVISISKHWAVYLYALKKNMSIVN